jgi:hypothetical protein
MESINRKSTATEEERRATEEEKTGTRQGGKVWNRR